MSTLTNTCRQTFDTSLFTFTIICELPQEQQWRKLIEKKERYRRQTKQETHEFLYTSSLHSRTFCCGYKSDLEKPEEGDNRGLYNMNIILSRDVHKCILVLLFSNVKYSFRPHSDRLNPVSYTHLTLPTIYSV